MKTTEFVAAVMLKATGKVSTAISGDAKWNKVLGIGNFYIDSWQSEPDVDWNSLYDPLFSIGTVANTDTYELGNEVRKLSDTQGDYVVIYHADGNGYTRYEVVAADRLKQYYSGQNKESSDGNYCAQIGSNLVFNRIFVSTDPQFGGSIRVPVYTFAKHLVRDNDIVPVDDPNWLVVMSSAEYVRNDVTRQNQYPNLVNEANPLMESMKEKNEAQVSQIHRPWGVLGQSW